jgi:hypothetical protein
MRRIRFVNLLSCSEVLGPAERWLSFCELKPALVPFTDACGAVLLRAVRCACGCWVAVGGENVACPFCGATLNRGRTTGAWKRVRTRHDQLGPEHEAIASSIEDPQSYLIGLEECDYETDWENQQ